ncbi:MAG: YbjQ family protein [Chitinophagaceae bacterium]|nr:YbjQ family protein [Chitinophagaceae bacterium]
MAGPRDILVITTSPPADIKIKHYLRPVSAHLVAGTNLFSDFFASFSDVFGGRSESYQKQLTALYSEAIEKLKSSAYEIGANCIIGLHIDLDEISGKGKSMFMLTAMGTAVIIEKEQSIKNSLEKLNERFENIGVDRIDTLRSKKAILKKVEAGNLNLDDETWEFITTNQVDEIFPYLLIKFNELLDHEQTTPTPCNTFYKQLVNYIDNLPESKKSDLLYNQVKNEKKEKLALKICSIIKDLDLLDIIKSFELLKNSDFEIKKRGLWCITYDKPFYNKEDLDNLRIIREYILTNFVERGTRTTKKQLLSSKEKEVWTCECGKTNNDIGANCSSCNKDIYGFKSTETKLSTIEDYIGQKIELISEFLS